MLKRLNFFFEFYGIKTLFTEVSIFLIAAEAFNGEDEGEDCVDEIVGEVFDVHVFYD